MMTQTVKTQPNDPQYAINPTKMVMWLLIIASIMLFASFTSAYIVRRGEGNWLLFDLPKLFTYNTILIAISSVTMQWAYLSAKKDNLGTLKLMLFLTLGLGITFGILQWYAWKDLVANNIFLAGNPSESFVYIISGVHLATWLEEYYSWLWLLGKLFNSTYTKKIF